jgi:hypothetical protein
MYESAATAPVFEPTVDVWYVWVGLSLASAGALGAATALPTTPPPDATGAARVVDGVAGSPYAATGEHPLAHAEAVRLSPTSIGLRSHDGAAHASFRSGPVVPVGQSTRLRRVLDGTPPGRVFDDTDSLRYAVREARERARDPAWRPAPDTLRVRHVTWRGVDVTLVG